MGDDNPAFFKQNQTARETASQEANTETDGFVVNLQAGDTFSGTIIGSQDSVDSILEVISVAVTQDYANNVLISISITDASFNTTYTVHGTPQNWPATLDPGGFLPEGGEIQFTVINDSSTQVQVDISTVIRIL